jgi:hypothetical protein
LPVVNYAFSDLIETPRPTARARRLVEGRKVCLFCGEEYEQRPHEHPRRECCYSARCEGARERWQGGGGRDRKTPRPVLHAPPRPLRTGNS